MKYTARPPRFAYWTGYQLTTDEFTKFARTLPQATKLLKSNWDEIPFVYYLNVYDKWKNSLSKNDRRKALRVLSLFIHFIA
jgi:hypothetical protein